MTPRYALLLLLPALAMTASACCGDLTRTEDVRKDFIESFNAKKDATEGCTLLGKGKDLTDLVLKCKDKEVAWIEERVKPVCESFQPFGFESMRAVGKDGEANVAVATDCRFTNAEPTKEGQEES